MKKWIAMTMLALFSVAAFAQNNTKETAPAAKEIKGTVFEKGTLKELLAKAAKEKKYLFVDVYATWCGPCIKLGPVVEQLADKYADKALVGKFNVDEDGDLPTEFGIRNIPTVLFFRDGELKDRSVGLVRLSDLEGKLANIL